MGQGKKRRGKAKCKTKTERKKGKYVGKKTEGKKRRKDESYTEKKVTFLPHWKRNPVPPPSII